eukprot:CAMPEP_0185028712 /NCGR_PEP_ID=MMETSP1103-20130426/14649_1 /TAXON_ID=36769 /ORGANISM="Paraphysomonas bandaiensis, Strain Caron Lab Isolate" /LENGTH=101 /DNA_ID=CAMNT_0027563221 /DNA_START=340 /DNA_END=645 /DNA_ORIENTATION=-
MASWELVAGNSYPANLDTSSSLSTVIIIGAPTVTSEPASTNNLAMYKSSTASNPIVALSVSTSAIVSPADTASPSFLIHDTIVPATIVGERAGIPTTSWCG